MIVELIGWAGTVLIVLAYYLVSSGKIRPDSREYQLMNFFGAVSVAVSVLHKQAWAALALEIVWALIALAALLRLLCSKRS